MSKVTKVHSQDGDIAYYFVNGVRSDAYDDRAVLEELLGDDFQEYWLVADNVTLTSQDDEILSRMEASETEDEFIGILEDHPHLVEDI